MSPHSLADERDGFASQPAYEMRRRMTRVEEKKTWAGLSFTPMFAGVAVIAKSPNAIEVGICTHDGTYSTDYCVHQLSIPDGTSAKERAEMAIKHVLDLLNLFSVEHCLKFIGAGCTEKSLEIAPALPSRMWKELDIVTMVYKVAYTAPKLGFVVDPEVERLRQAMNAAALANGGGGGGGGGVADDEYEERIPIDVDEQADSAARKCTKDFGPGGNPCLSIGFRNQVLPDTGGKVRLVSSLDEYRQNIMDGTWNAVMKYATTMRERKIKLAFFSSTPQGGGVALMRHALLRFFRMAGIQARWYVPKPNPRVFRVTKTNHNILQGVAAPDVRLTPQQMVQIDEWILSNAERSWLTAGGPLAEGGADIVVIDDPQMPGLIPLIRRSRPEIPIIYRSHIEIRSDLVAQKGSPQEEVWKYLWEKIRHADVFISHPMESFVPPNVPLEMVALMPACTDWLDGLNKPLKEWDLRYYHHNFRTMCTDTHMAKLQYPQRNYIIQVARFDPSKGIPDVIDAFCKFRKRLDDELPYSKTPQLLICGHGAVDDPDASTIYDETLKLLDQEEYIHWANDIIVMRIGPSDQMLNALLTNATLALQLSTREGFEVKVSEALHHGKPTTATLAGGIPLQIQHGKTGYLIKPSDTTAAAAYMYKLWMDKPLRQKISQQAKEGVSDEVSTVGNALNWMYLSTKLSLKGLPQPYEGDAGVDRKGDLPGGGFKPRARWVFDLARKEAGEPWKPGEVRLPRGVFAERRRKELGSEVEVEVEDADMQDVARMNLNDKRISHDEDEAVQEWKSAVGSPMEG